MFDLIVLSGALNAVVNGIRFRRIFQYHLSYFRCVYGVSPIQACIFAGFRERIMTLPPVLGNNVRLLVAGNMEILSYSGKGSIRMGSIL